MFLPTRAVFSELYSQETKTGNNAAQRRAQLLGVHAVARRPSRIYIRIYILGDIYTEGTTRTKLVELVGVCRTCKCWAHTRWRRQCRDEFEGSISVLLQPGTLQALTVRFAEPSRFILIGCSVVSIEKNERCSPLQMAPADTKIAPRFHARALTSPKQ
eukprot:726450-Prorocentrum_minimum.AAC.4